MWGGKHPKTHTRKTIEKNTNRKLTARQKQLLEELRDEELIISGQKPPKKKSSADEHARETSQEGEADEESAERRNGWGSYLQDAFDRVKSHMAGKTKNAGSSS